MLALAAAVERDAQTVFGWLALALFIDGIDGTLARAVRIDEAVPWVDGSILDLVVDFLTYVFVPAVAMWRSDLLPLTLSLPVLAIMVAASAVYFGDRRMKTADNWFRGFPSLWNVLAFYIFVFALPAWINATVILVATACMFAPIVFVHPMRVRRFRRVTLAVTAAWFVFASLIWQDGMRGGSLTRAGLLMCTLYFLLLPLLRGSPWADQDVSGDRG